MKAHSWLPSARPMNHNGSTDARLQRIQHRHAAVLPAKAFQHGFDGRLWKVESNLDQLG
jgi:hypothetical protein